MEEQWHVVRLGDGVTAFVLAAGPAEAVVAAVTSGVWMALDQRHLYRSVEQPALDVIGGKRGIMPPLIMN